MKKLLNSLAKKFIKLLFGIIVPAILILYTVCSFFTVPVKILLVVIFVIQALLWFSAMQNIKLLPNMRTRYYKGVCLGFLYEDKQLYIALPFVYIELY